MKEEQINALLRDARAGEQDAFTALYNATSQDVYQTIRSMVRSEQLALDIQQEVYIRAFTHLDQLGDPSKFPSWLRVIAVNQTRTELRKQTPILFTELEREDGPEIPEISDDRPERFPELALEQKETAELVQEILGSLTDSQRLLVGMYYYEQIPVTKIAQDLNLSPGTVKTQLSRSRRKVETRVRALEEKGVKLYGLSPMPFLLALLRRLKPAEKAEKQVLADALTESGVAQTAMIHVGKGLFHTVAGKVLAGLAAAAIIGGGIAGFSWYRNRSTEPAVGDARLNNTAYLTDDRKTPEDSSLQTEDGTSEETADVIVTGKDSPEDLTETPTEATTETPTEPPTNPPTEPPTEAPTEPPTEPPTNPVGADDHIGPAPEPASPQPTNPAPSDTAPTDPIVSTDPTNPTDPAVPSSENTEPYFLRWYWLNHEDMGSMDLSDGLDPRDRYILCVEVRGDLAPSVTMDREDVIDLNYQGKEDSDDGIGRYTWAVTYAGSGTVHLSCALGSEPQGSLAIENPERPAAFLRAYWASWKTDSSGNTIPDKLIGDQDTLWVCVQNADQPNIYTDDPSVLEIGYQYERRGNWNEYDYGLLVEVKGCGTAHVYVEMEGKLVYSCTVQAPENPKSIVRFQWMNENETSTYGVGDFNYIEMLVEGNEIPRVYSDNPDIVSLTNVNGVGYEHERIRGYYFKADMLAPGIANIVCEYEGRIAYEFQVTVNNE